MAKEKIDNQPIINPGDLRGLLHEYREKAGYSLNQMADALCLSEETIEKLENEEFESLAEPPYIRGYLRNYAKIAESDPGELINRYEALRGADPSELDYHFKKSSTIHSGSSRRMSPVFAQLFFLALLIAFLAGISMIPGVNKWITETWESISTQTATQEVISTDNPLLTGTMPVPTPLPIDEEPVQQIIEKPATPEIPSATEKPQVPATAETTNEEPKKEEAPKPTTDNQSTSQEQTAQTQTEEKKEAPTTNSDIINIKLVFSKEVWLRIRDKEKKTLFEAMNTAGNEKTLELKKPLTFRVGNAQGLALFVDNKPVDISSYIKGSVANFTLE